MSTHQAWALVCRLFAGGTPVFRSALSPAELRACAALGSAIKPTVANRTFALCPYCQLRSGQIFSNGQGGQICHCPDCGPVPLAPDDRTALELDESWLRSKLRTALGIESRDSVVDLDDGVWRLGAARRDPVLLARNLNRLWANQSLFDRVRVPGGNTRVIAPRTSQLRGSPFPAGTEWLPLEERFMLYGGGISFIAAPSAEQPASAMAADPAAPCHGPFSEDFRWVTLDKEQGEPIHCTPGQASVFRALWAFKGQWRTGEQVMKRANLTSSKPNDVFKAAQYGRQRKAYQDLVQVNEREGLYSMPCAGQQSSSTTKERQHGHR
jgi:hypothetical protein